jgi:glycosyltransferase involved in cell wall biosynthesis
MGRNVLRVCLIATELRGFGAYGGFGVLTYDIAVGLSARGVEVYIAMPRKDGQKPIETFDGITVVSYPSPLYIGLHDTLSYAGLYRMIDADIYHSQEPSIGAALAQVAEPRKKHIVTFQDPRSIEDWRKEWAPHTESKLNEWKFWFQYQQDTGKAARRAHAKYCQAKYIIDKVKGLYKLREKPEFLPNPIKMPPIKSPKAVDPTVCYVGRWDARKRPQLFLELAVQFPGVKFLFGGACLNDRSVDAEIRRRCSGMRNIEAPGWLNDIERTALLEKSWILVNTSTRECLPVSYLEAGANKCAILSHCNADDFASNFGFWAERGDLEDYVRGLKILLENNRWKALGENANDYVRNTHEYDKVIDQHMGAYRQVLSSSAA